MTKEPRNITGIYISYDFGIHIFYLHKSMTPSLDFQIPYKACKV